MQADSTNLVNQLYECAAGVYCNVVKASIIVCNMHDPGATKVNQPKRFFNGRIWYTQMTTQDHTLQYKCQSII